MVVVIQAGPGIHRSVSRAKWGLSIRWQQARDCARYGPHQPGEGALAAVTGRVQQIVLAGHRFGSHKATSPATGLDTTLRIAFIAVLIPVTIRAGRTIHRRTLSTPGVACRRTPRPGAQARQHNRAGPRLSAVAIDIAPGTDHYLHRASSPSTH